MMSDLELGVSLTKNDKRLSGFDCCVAQERSGSSTVSHFLSAPWLSSSLAIWWTFGWNRLHHWLTCVYPKPHYPHPFLFTRSTDVRLADSSLAYPLWKGCHRWDIPVYHTSQCSLYFWSICTSMLNWVKCHLTWFHLSKDTKPEPPLQHTCM